MMGVVAALDSVWIVGLLWALAVAAGVWIIVPAIGFAVYPLKFEVEVNEDPRVAEARGEDAAYDGWFQEFAALGFVPLGKTVEKCRFFTPLHWNWRSTAPACWRRPIARRSFVCTASRAPIHCG